MLVSTLETLHSFCRRKSCGWKLSDVSRESRPLSAGPSTSRDPSTSSSWPRNKISRCFERFLVSLCSVTAALAYVECSITDRIKVFASCLHHESCTHLLQSVVSSHQSSLIPNLPASITSGNTSIAPASSRLSNATCGHRERSLSSPRLWTATSSPWQRGSCSASRPCRTTSACWTSTTSPSRLETCPFLNRNTLIHRCSETQVLQHVLTSHAPSICAGGEIFCRMFLW